MKKSVTALASLMLVGLMSVPALAANCSVTDSDEPMVIAPAPTTGYQQTIQIDGQKTDVTSTVMVPLRALGEKLGFTVTWKDGEAKLENKDIYTVVRPGDTVYFITTNHEDMVGMSSPISYDAVPYISNGTTYVSLDFFKTLMDYQDGSITLDGNTIQISTKAENNNQTPNPFQDCASLAEAQKLTGFAFQVPDTIDGYADRTISVMDGKMTQVVYSNQKDQSVLLRKAAGSEDISGDYNTYAQNSTVQVKGSAVTLKGNDNKVFVAVWTQNGYTFAIDSDAGLSAAQMTALVQAMA